MLISELLIKDELKPFFVDEIKENNAEVIIDASYYQEGKLNNNCILNISIDSFYASLKLAETPCSIDNLVLLKRDDNRFSLYLIELKDVQKMKRLDPRKINEKFKTTIFDFMKAKYQDNFEHDDIKVHEFNLWLVCNKFKFVKGPIDEVEYRKKIENTVIEQLMLLKPFTFKGKWSRITPMYPGAEIN